MENKRIYKWLGGAIVLGLIVWGVIALEQSSQQAQSNLTPPQVDEVNANDHIKGNPEAGLTLIEYSDFQCPACAAYFPIVKRLAEDHEENLRIVYRHFPLTSIHRNAIAAAQASEAAGRQDKFWEMHDLIFINQSEWQNSSNPESLFTDYAESLGLDTDKFTSDLRSNEIRDIVEAQRQSAIAAGLNSTPSFILNGEIIKAPQDYTAFSQLIEQKINEQSDESANTDSATTTAEQAE